MNDTPVDWRAQALSRAMAAEVQAKYTLTDEEEEA